jgi:hypothetical protein
MAVKFVFDGFCLVAFGDLIERKDEMQFSVVLWIFCCQLT